MPKFCYCNYNILITKSYGTRAAVSLHWVRWDDEYVVFEEASGQTHQLDAVRAFILNILAVEPLQYEVILEELIGIPALTEEPQLDGLLNNILNEFSTRGLVEVTA